MLDDPHFVGPFPGDDDSFTSYYGWFSITASMTVTQANYGQLLDCAGNFTITLRPSTEFSPNFYVDILNSKSPTFANMIALATTGTDVFSGGLGSTIELQGGQSVRLVPKPGGWAVIPGNTNKSTQNLVPLFDHYADQTTSGSSATILYTDTIAANQLSGLGQKLYAFYAGSATGGFTIVVNFGGTQIASFTVTSLGTNDWSIKVVIIEDSTTSVRCSVEADVSGTIGPPQYTTVTGLDFTTGLVLDIVATSASAAATASIGYGQWLAAA